MQQLKKIKQILSDNKRLWNAIKVLLKIAFTILLIYLVLQKINFKEIQILFLKSNPVFILLAFLTYFLSQIVSSWRLLSFLKSIGLELKFGFNFRLYLLGMFYNVFLPGGIGGDGYKIYLLRKKFKLPTKRIFLALFFDRLSGLWAIGFIAVVLIIFIPKIDISITWPLAALFLGTLVYFVIIYKFFKDYSRYFWIAHLKAGVVQSLQLVSVIFILLGQNFDGKFSPYLFSFLVSTVAANLPLSVGGLGAREYAMTHASTFFGMDQNLAVFISATFWLLSTIASLAGIWSIYYSKEFERLPSQEKAEEFEKEADQALTVQ